jgi:formaldehyde-activating enzyme involved in methanogenesis
VTQRFPQFAPDIPGRNALDVGFVGDVPVLSIDVAAQPASVGCVRRWVVAFAAANGATGARQGEVGRAVAQAVSAHALNGAAHDVIRVVADVEASSLEILVSGPGEDIQLAPSLQFQL